MSELVKNKPEKLSQMDIFSAPKNAARGAQEFEPSEDDQEAREGLRKRVLLLLEQHRSVTTDDLVAAGGHRFATSIQALRERGYYISTERLPKSQGQHLYTLRGFERLVRVTDSLQSAYYRTGHWRAKARERKEYDHRRCVQCGEATDLHTHHWVYHLFAEELYQLSTYCADCHKLIHSWVSISFPASVGESIVERIRNECQT